MNVQSFTLTVPGQPVPQARARRGKNGHWYTPRQSQEFQERVRAAWMVEGRPRVEGWFALSARFYMPRPVSHYRTGKHSHLLSSNAPAFPSGCDVDNLLKGLVDALNPHGGESLAWDDDRKLVCLSGVHKLYADTLDDVRSDLDVWAAHPPS